MKTNTTNSTSGDCHYYQLTAHPEIFAAVYWGNHRCNALDEDVQFIASCRNEFVRHFKVTSCDVNLPDCFATLHNEADRYLSRENTEELRRFLDHREAYRTKDHGVICLVSPYDPNRKIPQSLKSFGFKRLLPLYALSAASFGAFFDSEQAYHERQMALMAHLIQAHHADEHETEVSLPDALQFVCYSGRRYLQRFRGQWVPVRSIIAEGMLRAELSLSRSKARQLMRLMKLCPLPIVAR